jgi:DNA-binding XRE family transcriptional regulator
MKINGTKPRSLALRIEDAFPEGWGKIPNNPLVAAAIKAIFKSGPNARRLIGGWSDVGGGRLVYRHLGKRGGQITVYIEAEPSGDNGAAGENDLARQWSAIEAMSPLTADVLLAVLAQVSEPSLGNKSKYPLLAPVAITATTILKYKNMKRWGEEGAGLRARIREEIGFLHRLRFDVHQYPAWDPSKKRWNAHGVSTVGDRLFEVVEEHAFCREPKDGGALSEVVWLTRAGHWSQWWMNAQAKVWLCPIPRRLLEFDHRKNRGAAVLAKKIGLNTMVLWGVVRTRGMLVRRIDHLLEDIGELPEPDARDSHWVGRTRDRFDEAILMLQEANLIGKVDWPGGCGPGDADRSKGWARTWLSCKLTLNRPGNPAGEDGAISRRVRKKSNRVSKNRTPKQPCRGHLIRAVRAGRGLSQAQLAQELRVSTSYLSQIENEKRSPSAVLLERLTCWMSQDEAPGPQLPQQEPNALVALSGNP